MNIVLLLIGTILAFTALVMIERFFGKFGIVAWVCIASISANILVCKSVDFFGATCALGNVMFASTYLATDISTEKYGKEFSRRAVYLSVCAVIIFVVAMQIGLLFTPSESDLSDASMQQLFSLNLRTSVASVSMFALSNLADVWLYDRIKRKLPDKMWVRNNVSTILCNGTENFLFTFLAFGGILDVETILTIAITGTIVEMVIAICDTPFLYWSTREQRKAAMSYGKEDGTA